VIVNDWESVIDNDQTELLDPIRDGVVRREVKPTSPPTVEYRLTPLGNRLIPAIEAIVEVGNELKRLRAVS